MPRASHHPNGAVAGYTLNNSIAHTLTQNTRGLPLVNRDAGVMQDQYGYDANGNVTAITDQQEGVFHRSMGYDDLDRLASASAPNVWGSATYKYDTVDNLRSATVGSRNSTFNLGANNQLASVTTNGGTTAYGFDRGNLISKGAQSFGFDLGNRMSWSSLGGSYAYDGLGRRFRINSSDTSTRLQLYSQAGQLLWASSSGGPRPASTAAYVYLGGKQIAEVNSVTGAQFVHTDALGSPVAHTNAAGTVINRSRFEPYGYVAAGTKPSANTSVIGFTGHVQDAETDLVYMQQRYYDPIAGRFLSVDPVVTNADTGKSFGRYHYGNNNPYKFVDPDGRDTDLKDWTRPKGMSQEEYKVANQEASKIAVFGAAAVLAPIVAVEVSAASATAAAAGNAVNAARTTAVAANTSGASGGAASGLVTQTGETFVGLSTRAGGPGMATNPTVQAALDAVPVGARAPFHGACGEICAMSSALNAGAKIEGAVVATVRVLGREAGKIMTACPSCSAVAAKLGVTVVSPN